MSKSIKANYIYTIANTFLGLIFPLITFPYVSRTLQPEGFGLYNFYNSIIAYVGLFANIGISLYATREVARHREDLEARSKLTAEIFLLNLITTCLAYSSIFILGSFVPRIHENSELFYVMSISILLGPLSVNWFFQAMEDFKYITIRSLLVKLLSLIFLLTFVKEKEDVMIYAIVGLIATTGNNLFNIIHLRKFIRLKGLKWTQLSIFRHLRPSLMLFVLNIAISIYVNLDSVMLGFIQSDEAVGYYTVAGRISHIILSLVTSLGVVLLPRFSYLLEANETEEFNRLCRKSMDFTLGISLPIVVGLIMLASPLITFVFGQSYKESVLVLQLISPIILFAGITNVLGIQILYPKGKEKLMIYSTIGAAIVNFSLNFVLIPSYSYNGAAFSTCVAEFVVLLIQLWLGKQYFPEGIISKNIFDYLMGVILSAVVLWGVLMFRMPMWAELLLGSVSGALAYFVFLILRKNELAQNILFTVKNKIKWT